MTNDGGRVCIGSSTRWSHAARGLSRRRSRSRPVRLFAASLGRSGSGSGGACTSRRVRRGRAGRRWLSGAVSFRLRRHRPRTEAPGALHLGSESQEPILLEGLHPPEFERVSNRQSDGSGPLWIIRIVPGLPSSSGTGASPRCHHPGRSTAQAEAARSNRAGRVRATRAADVCATLLPH